MYEWLRVQLYNDNHSVLTLIIKYILVHLKMSMFLKRIAYTKIVCPYFLAMCKQINGNLVVIVPL